MSTSLNSWCIPPQHCCHRRFLSSAPLERCSHQRSTLQQHWAQATRLRAPLAAAYSEGGTPFSRPRADLGTNSDAAASSSSSGSSGGRSRAAYPDRANPGSGGDGGNSSSFSRFSGEAGAPTAPWALMGRVIREDSVDLWQGARWGGGEHSAPSILPICCDWPDLKPIAAAACCGHMLLPHAATLLPHACCCMAGILVMPAHAVIGAVEQRHAVNRMLVVPRGLCAMCCSMRHAGVWKPMLVLDAITHPPAVG